MKLNRFIIYIFIFKNIFIYNFKYITYSLKNKIQKMEGRHGRSRSTCPSPPPPYEVDATCAS
jgi:hypothetical protein